MTDNEIIKALECCIAKDIVNDRCDECPNLAMGSYCMDRMLKNALDLIKRQQAEIERLRYNLKAVLDERADHTDAIKEFAEELIKRCSTEIDGYYGEIVWTDDIDNLVKEMAGADGAL